MKVRLAVLASLASCLTFAASPALAGKVNASITLDRVTTALAAQSAPALGN